MAIKHKELLLEVLCDMTNVSPHSPFICDIVHYLQDVNGYDKQIALDITRWIAWAIEQEFSYESWLEIKYNIELSYTDMKIARIKFIEWMIENDNVFDNDFDESTRAHVTKMLLQFAGD